MLVRWRELHPRSLRRLQVIPLPAWAGVGLAATAMYLRRLGDSVALARAWTLFLASLPRRLALAWV
jgi:hypothetical protein